MITTVSAALAGGYLLERLNVPAGALIGAMAAVAALNLSSFDTADFPGGARCLMQFRPQYWKFTAIQAWRPLGVPAPSSRCR